MGKYRILEVTHHPSNKKEYYVQKRFLGFLWWFDPFDDGMYSDGHCNTYDEALNLINNTVRYRREKKVVWTNE